MHACVYAFKVAQIYPMSYNTQFIVDIHIWQETIHHLAMADIAGQSLTHSF